MMKLLLIITFLSFPQNNNIEYYKNGSVKYEKISTKSGDIIKEYYKNGHLKKMQNEPEQTIETYYKNGLLSYQKNNKNDTLKEEFYDRSGSLTIQIINDLITFSIYENGSKSTKKDEHGHSHWYNHKHGQNHDHHH